MDNFRVPRKVNRHVLKAISYITDNEDLDYASFADIKDRVKYSMRNCNPVHRLEYQVESSLYNLTKLGVISISADSKAYAIRNVEDMLIKVDKLGEDDDQPGR